MPGRNYFISGTDTEVGKTRIACGLLHAFGAQGMSSLALKPVAAGCDETPQGLRNDDALRLMAAMSLDLPYEQVNPVALKAAIAPHIAAEWEGKALNASRIAGYCRGAMLNRADVVVVEGAGGWRVPLNHREMLSAVPRDLGLGVILVVGMRLGCLNHAVLSAEAILRDGLKLVGWVGNRVDPDMACYDENCETLRSLLPAPCLGFVPWLDNDSAESVAAHLDIQALL